MAEFYRHLLYCLLLIGGTGLYAGLRGGAPERLASLTILLDVLLSGLVARPWQDRFGDVELGILIVDSLALAAAIAIALLSERHWPKWLAAIKIVQVAAHLPILIRPEVNPAAYHFLQLILSWMDLPILPVATYRHQQRLRRYGSDKPWNGFSLR